MNQAAVITAAVSSTMSSPFLLADNDLSFSIVIVVLFRLFDCEYESSAEQDDEQDHGYIEACVTFAFGGADQVQAPVVHYFLVLEFEEFFDLFGAFGYLQAVNDCSGHVTYTVRYFLPQRVKRVSSFGFIYGVRFHYLRSISSAMMQIMMILVADSVLPNEVVFVACCVLSDEDCCIPMRIVPNS